MHYIIFLTLSTKTTKTKELVVEKVTDWMEWESEYANKKWDWWYIGGRYSGWLANAYEFSEEYKEFIKGLDNKYGNDIGRLYSGPDWMMEKQVEYHKEADEWWYKNAPIPFSKNPSPTARDSFESNAYDDDILVIDKELYQEFLKDITEPIAWRDGNQFPSLRFYDLDKETPSEEFVGKKWIILIDAHI